MAARAKAEETVWGLGFTVYAQGEETDSGLGFKVYAQGEETGARVRKGMKFRIEGMERQALAHTHTHTHKHTSPKFLPSHTAMLSDVCGVCVCARTRARACASARHTHVRVKP